MNRPRAIVAAAILCAALGSLSRADLITTSDNRSFFGKLKTFDGKTATVQAWFPEGFRSFEIVVGKLKRIEFNSQSVNTGAAPESLAARPRPASAGRGAQTSPVPEPAPPDDSVFLFGNSTLSCRVIGIDESNVRCPSQSVSRTQVKSIRFAVRAE